MTSEAIGAPDGEVCANVGRNMYMSEQYV
jgi:hypothetical protein